MLQSRCPRSRDRQSSARIERALCPALPARCPLFYLRRPTQPLEVSRAKEVQQLRHSNKLEGCSTAEARQEERGRDFGASACTDRGKVLKQKVSLINSASCPTPAAAGSHNMINDDPPVRRRRSCRRFLESRDAPGLIDEAGCTLSALDGADPRRSVERDSAQAKPR